MTQRLLIAGFEHEEEMMSATRIVRGNGCRIVDAYTPYAVHGLDEAMGLAPSRLPWVCFVCGLLGALFAFWFQYWSLAVDWPINVGGRPWNSLPAYLPIAFEVMVLLAGFGVVIAFFICCRLYPGKRHVAPARGVTDNSFVLVIEPTEFGPSADRLHRLLKAVHALYVEERATNEVVR